MKRETIFSPCRKYRYALWREWARDGGLFFSEAPGEKIVTPPGVFRYLMVIGLNPSTADETKDDPTIRRCIDFAKRWGFGALCMTNLFAWRDTKPAAMKAAIEPCGMDNGKWITEIAENAGMILAAWGKHGSFCGRDKNVLSAIRSIGKSVYALQINSDGSPKHPLYVAANVQPILLE